MLITNNEEMAKRARLLRSHGMTTMSYQRASGHATSYDIMDLGYNFRLDDIRASIAVEQLKKLKKDLNQRTEVRKLYIDLLRNVRTLLFFQTMSNLFNYIMPIVKRCYQRKKR